VGARSEVGVWSVAPPPRAGHVGGGGGGGGGGSLHTVLDKPIGYLHP